MWFLTNNGTLFNVTFVKLVSAVRMKENFKINWLKGFIVYVNTLM